MDSLLEDYYYYSFAFNVYKENVEQFKTISQASKSQLVSVTKHFCN